MKRSQPSTDPNVLVVACAAPRGTLQFRVEPHARGLYCTRALLDGIHEPIHMATFVRSRDEWRAFLRSDEYFNIDAGFFFRLEAAGERLLPS